MAEGSNPVLVALGWLMAVLGGLWTLLAGCCTLVFLAIDVAGAVRNVTAASLSTTLVFGAVGIVPGAAIAWAGITIIRGQRRLARSGGGKPA